jgi:diguanylate cyclase (GGDEF)-like protein
MPDETPESRQKREIVRLVAILLVTGVVSYWAVFIALERITAPMSALGEKSLELLTMTALCSICLWVVLRTLVRPLQAERNLERRRAALREEELLAESKRQEFDGRLHRALEMSATEDMAYDVVGRVLHRLHPDRDSELLVADSSDAHLKQVVAHEPAGGGGCLVVAPHDCPAVRRGQSQQFSSSEEIDACPHLRDRARGACSAVCVPVNIMGKAVGVLHVVAAANESEPAATAELESLANHAGTRIGMLRVMERTQVQAATDPLTGLLNRRSFENEAHNLLSGGAPFALAMGDLDFFKRINDVHGHDAGDRALRLFARTLQTSVRSHDLVCRFGGEEFVVLLPELGAGDAAAVLQRVQEELLIATSRGGVPPFTVSFGVTDSSVALALEDIIRQADGALLQSKRDGRNRVTVVDGGYCLPMAEGSLG